ncbi:M16 family metallopeptidase [Gloeobacter morelensis]|uniref:M16 family metallopeptidase n=1 Tax=Gloeobacter morelensis TaxID=2907343 RepID=UPI001E34832A|nr:pitrilysin family protein [Gloeobacter morelensis]
MNLTELFVGRFLLGLMLAGMLSLGAAVRAESEAVPLPPVQFSERTLANGLRVLLVEDHTSPTVAIQVAYHVGGKDDPPGRSGFAHLFEHLMFKGTANTKPETLDRLTEDVGGFNNAFTSEDITNYFEVVPSNYLETLLWAEADRLGSLVVDETNFKTERQVVIGEYDQRVLASPYGMLFELLDSKSYTVHPYRRGVIGNPAELNAATLEDVQNFHRTYYQPDNATLVVVGDFDPVQANRWIDQYFGAVPNNSRPIPRVSVVEPKQSVERRTTYYGANVPLPAVALVYHGPARSSPDRAALDVLENVLSQGQSARLYRTLVYEQQVASQVSSSADLREQPGLFVVYAILNAGKKPEQARALLDGEIAKLQQAPVPEAELAKAKTQLIAELVRGREQANDRATELVLATLVGGDPRQVNTALEEIQKLTAQDVQRVARQYLVPTNRTVIDYLPRAMPPAGPTKKERKSP